MLNANLEARVIRKHAVAFLMLVSACSRSSAPPAATPMYGAWGFDAAGQDSSLRPGDDFFGRINGGWLARAVIPPDKSTVGVRALISDTTEARLHSIMTGAASTAGHQPTDLEGKVGAYFRAFMDSTAVEKRGIAPLEPLLDSVRAANTRERIAALMGRTNRDFTGSLFSMYIDVDLKDTKIYSLYLNQRGLGLPDRDYYLKPAFAAQRDAYQRYAATLLHLLEWPDADARARDIMAFETAIAKASWTKVQQRDPNAEYNPMTVAELAKLAPGFDWQAWLASGGLAKVSRVVVGEKSAFPKLVDVFAHTSIETLQAWEAFTIADNASVFLPAAFGHAYFEMRLAALSGQQAEQVRWKRAVHAIAGGDYGAGDRFDRFGSVGFGVGQLYTARYFPPTTKAKIDSLVTALKAAFHARIATLDWMSQATREQALKKLDTYQIKVGYPDHPRDYSSLLIRDDDLLGDARCAGALDWQFYVDRFDGPVDRTDWLMTPQTNDAYNGSLRDIVFPAGILQPPVFDANADMAINYGAAGAIIGHELMHGFDDAGRAIDADGVLRDWWQAADAKAFEARAKMLAAQYSVFQVFSGIHVNGELTLGENIADLGGVVLALDAYRLSLGGKPAPVIDGFTGDQRVFIGWAQAFRRKATDDAIKRQVASDPHSPPAFRVNGPMRNIDAWYAAFGVGSSDKLYVPPEKRVRIW